MLFKKCVLMGQQIHISIYIHIMHVYVIVVYESC